MSRPAHRALGDLRRRRPRRQLLRPLVHGRPDSSRFDANDSRRSGDRGAHLAPERIGLTAAGAIQTPPLDRDSHAYWLTVSPDPGQLGPATIIGHVDSAANGPAVFFRLGALRQRDTISVTRADGNVAVFQVERVVAIPES